MTLHTIIVLAFAGTAMAMPMVHNPPKPGAKPPSPTSRPVSPSTTTPPDPALAKRAADKAKDEQKGEKSPQADDKNSTPATAQAVAPRPVVVEFFTSEGCSSCPAAEDLAGRLDRTSTTDRPLIVLAFHVDYWDYLGWKDAFASTAFTERQQQYQKALGSRSLYTPQAIINGQVEAVGSDRRLIEKQITTARTPDKKGGERGASKPLPTVTAELQLVTAPLAPAASAQASSSDVLVRFQTDALPAGAVVHVALTQSNIRSKVTRGENAGRNLEHDRLVRDFKTLTPSRAGGGEARFTLPPGSKPADLSVVVYVQDPATMQILSATDLPLANAKPAESKPAQSKPADAKDKSASARR